MPEYTQANRPIRVDTVLDEDTLLLNGFNGLEGMSQVFTFQLDLLSTRPDIDPEEMLRTPMLITMRLDDGKKRLFHGICTRFSQGVKRDDLTTYRAEIVPWLWFLRLSRESRIYQELTVPEILEQVFERLRHSDFELRLTRPYQARTYCVQYRETHFEFVSRLMEEEGIFYYFEHSEDRHLLVLSDDSSLSAAAPGAATARYTLDDSNVDEYIWEMEREHSVHTGKVTLSDYDFEQPNLDLLRAQGDDEREELYDYPGRYTQPDDGERLALLWLETEEMQRQIVTGEGNVRGLIPGFQFTLQEHYRSDANGKYLITQVQHLATAGQFRAWDSNAGLDYQNTFSCIPDGTPYRPPRRTQRPLIHGSQSALVVGPSGEEIHTDKYGRVKVQFYWDRDGKRDENSSCWVRVTTPWGGKGYGSVSIPRIGNEVLIAFEEGDPDRPIIIGSLYNADQTPPFDLPGAGITMGMNSRSSPGGGGNNQIALTDTKGKEMMNINAQFDQVTTVGNDQTNTINNNRTTNVAVDDTEDIGANQAVAVHGNQSTTVDGNQTTSVSGNQTTTVDGSREVTAAGDQSVSVGGSETVGVGGDRATDVGGSETVGIGGDQGIEVGGGQTISIGADGELSVGANYGVNAGATIVVDAGATIEITAGATITLSAGGSSIEIGPAGVTIETGAIVTVQGATIKLN